MKSLAADNKITQPQAALLVDHVETLNEAQFAAFSAIYVDAPEHSLFAGSLSEESDGVPDATPDAADEAIEVQREIVQGFRFTGQSEEWIQNSDAYRTLTKLEAKES